MPHVLGVYGQPPFVTSLTSNEMVVLKDQCTCPRLAGITREQATVLDSSDEEGAPARRESSTTAPIRVQPPRVSAHERTIGTQTIGTMPELVVQFAC